MEKKRPVILPVTALKSWSSSVRPLYLFVSFVPHVTIWIKKNNCISSSPSYDWMGYRNLIWDPIMICRQLDRRARISLIFVSVFAPSSRVLTWSGQVGETWSERFIDPLSARHGHTCQRVLMGNWGLRVLSVMAFQVQQSAAITRFSENLNSRLC